MLQNLLSSYPFIAETDIRSGPRHLTVYTTVPRRSFLMDAASRWGGEYRNNLSYPIRSSVGGVVFPDGLRLFAKPSSAISPLPLKPKSLGLDGVDHRLSDYSEAVKTSVSRGIANTQIVEFLCSMVDHHDLGSPLRVDMFTAPDFHLTLPSRDIAKNFGEVLGPISAAKDFTDAFGARFPSNDNFPLLDFYLLAHSGEIAMSSKVGKIESNTLKPSHIISLLDREKWGGSKEFRVLSILSEETMAQGAFSACRYLSMEDGPFRAFRRIESLEQLMERSGVQSRTEMVYRLDNLLVEASKRFLNFSPLVCSALGGRVHYISTNLDVTPTGARSDIRRADPGEWDAASIRIVLRNKNSSRRLKDKLGFDIRVRSQ